uniref:Helicase ATP-binding domain-containing protein n=1 Tax=viral metagenome TaxID=1070528 RepID=A0A6C0H4C7_9ZZZZ
MMLKKISPKNRDSYVELQQIIETLKKNGLNSYLGNKGYSMYKICLTPKIIEFIKNELTVKPFTQNSYAETKSFPIYQESEKKIYVPRCWGIKMFGYPKLLKISFGESINLNFKGQLRDYQTKVLNEYLKAIEFGTPDNINKGNGTALIELWTGAGKTVLGLKIIEVLKKKTIIFVHKTFLKNQWVERIEEYLPGARIGTIQGQIVDIENKDIVLAMIQSVSMKDYHESLFDSFGLSLYDECHHMSSEVFSNCLKKCNTLYGLGLSATMERKDGLTNVFKMYLGDICYKHSKNSSQDNVLVKAIDFIVQDNEYNEVEHDFRGQIKYSTMVSKISNFNLRSDFIVHILESEMFINPKQQFIVLAQTKNLLNYLYKALCYKNFASVGYYIGGMKEDDLKKSESKKIILATFSMAAEALDIKSLTSLFLASPKSDIIQAVGRILREKHSNPLIIDLIDNHDVFLNQFAKRRAFYNEKNYKIIRTNQEKYNEYIKYLKSLSTTIKTDENCTISIIEKEIVHNIINQERLQDFPHACSLNYWSYLLYKSRKTNLLNNTKQLPIQGDSKCLILL